MDERGACLLPVVEGRAARLLPKVWHASDVRVPGLEELHLAVGSLDEPGRFRPVIHYGSEGIVEPFFTDDGLPRERTDEDEEFMAMWRAAYGPDSVPGSPSGS